MAEPSRVALITGASRGIGRQIALSLAKRGMSVGLVARGLKALEGVRRDCTETGSAVEVVAADVTVAHEVGSAVEAVRSALGPIDLLVNNAGRIESREVSLWETDANEWWEIVETNLRGPFLFCHAVLPEMVERGKGRIVNISTGAAIADAEIYSGYRAAKTALLRLTGSILAGAARHGITAFDVSPGHVATDMTRAMEMHSRRTEWTPPKAVTDIVDAIAAGHADPLSGRYLRAGTDDVADMLERAAELAATDSRTLRLRPYGPEDPLA